MLKPDFIEVSQAALAVETPVDQLVSEAQVKPARKRAPRKPKVGVPKGMRVEIHPTPEQAAELRGWIGSTRWLWNWALGQQTDYYEAKKKSLSVYALSRDITKLLKDNEELVWLKQVPRTCLTQVFNHLGTSWKSFFDGLKGARADTPGKPRFRRRGGSSETVAFQVDPRLQSPVDTENRLLRITGMGSIAMTASEPIPGKVSTITIRCVNNQWFAALSLTDMDPADRIRKPYKTKVFEDPMDPTGLVSMDASVRHGAVATSDGVNTYSLINEAAKKKADEADARKKKYQRRQAKLVNHRLMEMGLDPKKPIPKGTKIIKSKRQEKLDRKVAGIDLHMLFAKRDLIHKFTTEMVRNHHTIVVETLALAAMAQSLNRGFRRNMHRACMGEIIRQLKYKCEWHGRTLIFVDKWFASSKRCSNPECHQKNAKLKLKTTAWVCPHCLTHHERDENAAFNLWQEGWRLLQQASTSCTVLAVGSTVSARGVKRPSQENTPVLRPATVKRETSRKTLA